MTDDPAMTPEVRDRIYGAVHAELLQSGIDEFSVDRVARRAGVGPAMIREHWHDRRVLLMDVLLARTRASMWSPDTGSLFADLNAVAELAVENSQTETGRALFRRVLPGSGDIDLAEIGADLWTARFRDAAQIFERAAARGQLRAGVRPEEAIRMFATAFYYDVIFNDAPVRADYADQVIDIFLHGIFNSEGAASRWPDPEELLRHPSGAGAADQAVEAARRAVVLMRIWADALLDPVVLYEAVRDDQGRIVDFVCRDLNRAACEEVGLDRSHLLGRTAVEMLPKFEDSGLLAQYAKCLEGGEPLVLNDFPYQHFDVVQRLDIRAMSAAADLLTVTWRDVSDRYASAQRDQRYRQLMDYSAVPAALANPDGSLVEVNQAMAKLLGYDVDTLLGMSWRDLTAPEEIEEESVFIDEIRAGRRDSYRIIKNYVHADGHLIRADLSLSCIRKPDGELEHFIGQIIDITGYTDHA